MHKPLLVPNLEARIDVRQDVEAMRRLYRLFVIVMRDVLCRADVAAMVKKVHAIEDHAAVPSLFRAALVGRVVVLAPCLPLYLLKLGLRLLDSPEVNDSHAPDDALMQAAAVVGDKVP